MAFRANAKEPKSLMNPLGGDVIKGCLILRATKSISHEERIEHTPPCMDWAANPDRALALAMRMISGNRAINMETDSRRIYTTTAPTSEKLRRAIGS